MAVNNFEAKKVVRCTWMLVVTELVTSGTECISLFPFQEYLIFPEIDDNNELAELEAMVAPVERFFNEDGKDFSPSLFLYCLSNRKFERLGGPLDDTNTQIQRHNATS